MRTVPTFLIVDDDDDILSLLTHFFLSYGHQVLVARDGASMRNILATQDVDLVILDIMMPGEDGLSVCTQLRKESNLPVIMLTAMTKPIDRIVGLELGADDYLTKPFDPRELLARIKAVLRRAVSAEKAIPTDTRPLLLFDNWKLDIARRELRSASAENTLVPLSGREFDLLLAFVERSQQVLRREQLLDLAHGVMHDAFDRSIDSQVSRLRRKLEPDVRNPTIIKTVRGGGYIFTPSVKRG